MNNETYEVGLSPFGKIVVVTLLIISVWWVLFGGTSAGIAHPQQMSIAKGEIIPVSYNIASEYSTAENLNIKISSNDDRILFSQYEQGPWDSALSLNQEVGPKSKTSFQYSLLADPNIPHGTYIITIEASKGAIYRATSASSSLTVN